MSLMNGARLGVGAQSVGVSQAAYDEALAYAKDRKQFGKAIIEFPAVFEMLSLMKAKVDASRALLYETTRFVDVYKAYNLITEDRSLTKEERTEAKEYQKWADMMTPLVKMFASEYANQNAYDSIQVHGGSGFMKDYACERIYRDARILTIYEGTSQLQVVAAIRFVTNGSYLAKLRQYEAQPVNSAYEGLRNRLIALTDKYEQVVAKVAETRNNEYIDFMARRMVEIAGHLVMSNLLIIDATRDKLFARSAEVYVNYADAEINKHLSFIDTFQLDNVGLYKINENDC
jgi:hypothetical protein